MINDLKVIRTLLISIGVLLAVIATILLSMSEEMSLGWFIAIAIPLFTMMTTIILPSSK